MFSRSLFSPNRYLNKTAVRQTCKSLPEFRYQISFIRTSRNSRGKNPLRGESIKVRYFPNETANQEIEDTIDISEKSWLKSVSDKSCADARGDR